MLEGQLTVVIPVFNRRRQVIEALDSVAGQSRLPDAIVVVDDGSLEPVEPEVRAWRESQPHSFDVRVVEQSNHGAAYARNRGLESVSETGFVAFLDSDDLWPADFLERSSAALFAVTSAVAVTSDRVFEVGDPPHVIHHRSSAEISASPTRWILQHGGGIGSATLFRAAPLRELGGYDESLPTGHDAALFLRVSLLGPWLYAPGDPVRYRSQRFAGEGEEDHLRYRHADFRRRWAEIDETFVCEAGGRQHLERSFYARHLARRWRLAGEQMLAGAEFEEARRCLRRSLSWHFKWRTLHRLAQTYRIGSARPPLSPPRPTDR